jgi:hypothetical protein
MKWSTIACLLLVGCAAMAPRPAVAPADDNDRARAAGLKSELVRAEDELGGAQALAAPRCERVCALVQNIVRLSSMICELAARHPGDDTLAAQCQEARLHAERARTRVPPSCGSCAAPR